MTRDEIIEAVRTLDEGKLSEAKRNRLIVALKKAFPHSRISDLIYYSTPELTAEEVADEAMRREVLWQERNDS